MNRKKHEFIDHVREHATIYIFMMILFLTGIIFGAIIVNSMNFIQKQDLFFYLERYFSQLATDEQIDNYTILKSSLLYHIKYLLLIFILGMSVIGLPIVWVLIFIKGLVIGFSVGFIVNQLGVKGLMLAALSIAPQNIIMIPIYLIAGSIAMIFSLILLRKLFSRQIPQPILQPFTKYIIAFLILLSSSLFGAIFEAYIASEAMESLIKSFY